MKETTNTYDHMMRIRRFEWEKDGKAFLVKLDVEAIQHYGLRELLEKHGAKIPDGRLPVFQGDREIGTLPEFYIPQSTSFLYDPRAGDFIRDGDKYIASPSLGPGDFEAIPSFRWKRK